MRTALFGFKRRWRSGGAQIAAQLHCVLGLLVLSEIALPRESEAIGAIAMDGTFSYGSNFSSGEIDEMQSEYRGFLEEQKTYKAA